MERTRYAHFGTYSNLLSNIAQVKSIVISALTDNQQNALKDDNIPSPNSSDSAELEARRKLRADTLKLLRVIMGRIKQYYFPMNTPLRRKSINGKCGSWRLEKKRWRRSSGAVQRRLQPPPPKAW